MSKQRTCGLCGGTRSIEANIEVDSVMTVQDVRCPDCIDQEYDAELTRLRAVAKLTVHAREHMDRNPDECRAALDEAVGMMEESR